MPNPDMMRGHTTIPRVGVQHTCYNRDDGNATFEWDIAKSRMARDTNNGNSGMAISSGLGSSTAMTFGLFCVIRVAHFTAWEDIKFMYSVIADESSSEMDSKLGGKRTMIPAMADDDIGRNQIIGSSCITTI